MEPKKLENELPKGRPSPIGFIGLPRGSEKKNITSGFRATGIWCFNPTTMVSRTSKSEPFKADVLEDEQRNEILQEGLPTVEGGVTHYYGSIEEEE